MGEKVTVVLSEQTVAWVERAVEDYDPLTATPEQNTPAMLACYAISKVLARPDTPVKSEIEFDSEALERLHTPIFRRGGSKQP